MRLSTFSALLLPYLASSYVIFPHAQPPSEILAPTPTATSNPTNNALPAPEPTADPLAANIDLREIVDNPAATLNTALPAASVTTQWVESQINGVATWVPVVFTYTFASVISQGALPGKGEIGMGSLTGQTGVTKTVQAGAAETVDVGRSWRRGALAVAVLGAGVLV